MEKIKEFYKKHREVILYLLFGAFTTVVSLAAYYLTFVVSEDVIGIPLDDTTSPKYVAVYTTAQVLQWCTGVLFAFVTNKKWVFTDSDKSASVWRQLAIFAGGRVLTFFLDYGLTYVGIMIFNAIMNGADIELSLVIIELTINAEFISKLIVAVIVVITNYILSRLFVFKKSKKKEPDETKNP